jgi:hypothetical protein
VGDRNINALCDILKVRCQEADAERAVVSELGHTSIELLRQLLTDINRCADALEVLARTARKGESWP